MISKAVKTTLKHQYLWVETELWLLLGVIFGSAFIGRIFPVPEWVSGIVILILFASVIKFMSENSLRSNTGSAFSWKFIMGLPLSKNEVLLLNLLSGLFLTIPFFCLMFAYWKFLSKSIFESATSLPLVTANFILVFSVVYMHSTLNLIEHPRKEFQKKNSSNQIVKFLKNVSLFLCGIFYILVFFDYLEIKFNLDIAGYFVRFLDFFWNIISGWWNVPLLMTLNYWLYQHTLKVWNNEKLTFKSLVWNSKKEYSILVVSFLLFAIGVYNTDFKTSSLYHGDIQKLVFKKDYKALEQKLDNGNINAKNKMEFTPMFVAIHEGNVEMVKFLEGKGASFEGEIQKTAKHKGYDALMLALDSGKIEMLDYMLSKNPDLNSIRTKAGFTPIHLATAKCRAEMVDHLIKAGAAINNVNDQGETPLIVATRLNCFSVAVSLGQAGADFHLQNKKGQTAYDLTKIKKSKLDKEFEYFLKKNTRMPASK